VRRIFGNSAEGTISLVPLRRSGTFAPGVISMNRVPVEPVEDEAEPTDKWAVPEEISGELTPPPIAGPAQRVSDRHRCRTVASPIPAILAETMDLALEDAIVVKPSTAQPIKTSPPRR
jgi:hypothetical protein